MEKLDAIARYWRVMRLGKYPCREQYTAQCGFAKTGRNVNDQVANIAVSARLKMITHRLHGEASANEWRWIDYVPRFLSEIIQAALHTTLAKLR